MSVFDRVVLIFNPHSTGQAQELAEELRQDLGRRVPGLTVQLADTEHAGHATELARAAAASGRPLVVSVSGDGGYNEVVNGVMQARNDCASSAVLAAGNANDHRRSTAQLPIAEGIARGDISRIDMLRLTAGGAAGDVVRYAHSYIGLGLTPVVAVDLEKGDKGSLREMFTVVRSFARFRPFEIHVEDGSRQRFDSLVFANIAQMAKVATLAEKTGTPDDGMFEVISLRHTAKMANPRHRGQGQRCRAGQAAQREHLRVHHRDAVAPADRRRSDRPPGWRHGSSGHRSAGTTSRALTLRLPTHAPAFSPTLRRTLNRLPVADRPVTPQQAAADHPTTGSPLVAFLPGLGLDADAWQTIRDELEAPSVVVLLPSLGRPACRRADLRVEAQATRVLASLEQGTPTILVGLSASCPVVANAAARWGDVVGLVLVGPVTDPTAQSWPRMLRQWGRTAAHERPSEAATLARQYRRTGPLSMLRGMNAVRRFRTDLALQSLDLQVEIVRGHQDRIATHEWSSELARVSHGHLTTIEGAAHMVPLTHPEAVVAAVDRILATPRRQTRPAVTRRVA